MKRIRGFREKRKEDKKDTVIEQLSKMKDVVAYKVKSGEKGGFKKTVSFGATVEQYEHVEERRKNQGLSRAAFMRSLVGRDIDDYKGVTKIIKETVRMVPSASIGIGAPPVPGSDAEAEWKARKAQHDEDVEKRREEMTRSMIDMKVVGVLVDIKDEIKKGVKLTPVEGNVRRPMTDADRDDWKFGSGKYKGEIDPEKKEEDSTSEEPQ